MMALNQLSQKAKWNLDVLKADFEAILADPQIDFSVDVTGFDQVFIDNLLMPDEGAEQDELPELPDAPTTRTGDLWRCGEHAILCGDSTKAESYVALMGGLLARMVFGDVPYNVRIAGNVSGLGKRKHGEFAMASGEMSRDQFVAFQRQVFEHCAGVSLDGALHFYFIDWRHLTEQMEAGEAVFGPAKQMIVWVKDNGAMGAFYRSRHELITVWRAGDAPHVNNFGLGSTGRYRTNVWEYPGCSSLGKGREAALAAHPTVKSLPMVIDGILDVTGRGELVLDPFGGSGTALIACERIGRVARLIEIDPKYVDVTLQRFIAETGEQPILDATCETFDAVAARRGAETEPNAELDWDIL
jgi:DNA modification methylase